MLASHVFRLGVMKKQNKNKNGGLVLIHVHEANFFTTTHKGPFKRFQHLPMIRSTKVERILGICWRNGVFKRLQPNSTFSRKKEMLNRSMLNECSNQFKFDSTHFQQAFNIFLRFQRPERPVQTPRHLVQQLC